MEEEDAGQNTASNANNTSSGNQRFPQEDAGAMALEVNPDTQIITQTQNLPIDKQHQKIIYKNFFNLKKHNDKSNPTAEIKVIDLYNVRIPHLKKINF